jgi:Ni/Co efflux regulator RcnB
LNPETTPPCAVGGPHRPRGRRACALLVALAAVALVAPPVADAQSRRRGDRDAAAERARGAGDRDRDKDKVQVFDFTGIDLAGRLRTPQLLYFLDRASEELQRASLERRSFLPELFRSIDEESL